MQIIKQLERLKKANLLIKSECTGNPDEFAIKLTISRSQLYNILEQLKDFGAPIKYNKKLNSFYYTTHFSLEINYSLKAILEDEQKTIFGGFSLRPILLDGTNIYL